ncbi:MAG TPA: TonB-dependent receptor [Acidobacteriaceae bacterium]|nr:TonB-dependent receptor [Acidobacteriaceae bacterium]
MGRLTRTILHLAILAMICFGLHLPAFAQFDTGTVNGTITDSSGAVIPNASITATNTDTSIRTMLHSDARGNFVAAGLPFGHYVVSATAIGFSPSSTQPITLTVGATVRVNLVLNVARANATVQVTGTGTTVDVSSSTTGTTLNSHQINNLPVNGRDVTDFLEISPGSVGSTAYFQGSVNGLDNIFTGLNIKLDGQSASRGDFNGVLETEGQEGARITRASIGSIQEIDFANSGYSAESGFSLGPQMNIITKGGTNDFHGTAYEFFRNNALDARDYFNFKGQTQAPLKLNQFGGNVGGPVVKDNLFFFANYEGARTNLTNVNSLYEVPSAYVRSQFVSSMQPILAMMAPLPAGCGSGSTPTTCNYDPRYTEQAGGSTQYDLVILGASLPDDTQEDTGSGRLDYQLGDHDHMFFRYNINNSLTTYAYGLNQGQVSPQALRTQLAMFNETHTFSPTLLNEFSLSVNRFHSNTASNTGAPYVQISGFFVNLGSLPGAQSFNQVNANTLPEMFDNVTKTVGRHTLRFGTQIRVNRLNTQLQPIEDYSYYSFQSLETNSPFLLSKNGTAGAIGNRSSNWDLYAQDDWRITANFTLNLGLRYDYNTTWNVAHKTQRNFDPSTQTFGPSGVSAYSAPRTDFAPRLGFAWDPYGQGQTVIHGYAGLFYLPMMPSPNTLALNMPQYAPVTDTLFDLTFFGGSVASISYPTPNPPLLPSNENVFIFPKNPRDPVSTNWLIGIEQQIANNTVMTINYTGNRVQHTQAGVAFQALNLNPSNPNPNVPRRLAAQGVPYQNENYMPNDLFSKYNALQVQVRRNVRNLTLEANYAWSHEIDDEVNVFAGFEDPLNPKFDRGNGDWDVRNNLTASAVYTLPKLKGSSRLVRETLGGWQASSILQARSGTAQNVEVTNGFFGNYMRPDYIPGARLKVPNASWPNSSYNLAAFKLNPAFDGVYGDPSTIGTVGRNSLRGPAFFQWDLSGMKNFGLTSKVTMQFRADIFNILNHPNFANVDTGICSAVTYPSATSAVCTPNTPDPALHTGFGIASATVAGADGNQIGNGTARQIQLSAKLIF